MPWRHNHVKKEAGTGLAWVVFEDRFDPATQKIAGQWVDAAGSKGRRRGRIEDDRSAKFAGFGQIGMSSVKGSRRTDSMRHLPDMKLDLAVEPLHGHRQFTFVREKELKNALANCSVLAQAALVD